MSHKTWRTRGEFSKYSLCGNDIRFIKDPDHMSQDDVDEVEATCWRCPVRGECIADVVESGSIGVWCASKFLPEPYIDDTKAEGRAKLDEAERIREELAGTIEDELKRRGEF